MPDVRQRFEIEHIGPFKLTERVAVPRKNEDGKTVGFDMKEQTRETEDGYMVYFPMGHSIRLESKAQLTAAGLTSSENIEIDMDTGLPVEPPQRKSIKQLVEGKTQQRGMR